MNQVKEPYYLDTYRTSIKSFTLPSIAKTNSFTSSIKRQDSSGSTTRNNISLNRSDSLEPYFKPNFLVNYDLDDNAIVDDDDDDGPDYTRIPYLPPAPKTNVRDDYDNETKFDFFL